MPTAHNEFLDSKKIHAILLDWHQSREALALASRLVSMQGLEITATIVVNGTLPDSPVNAPHPNIHFLYLNANKGYAGGINAAWALLDSTVRYVLLLNLDVQIDADCLRSLMAHLERRGDAGMMGPLLREGDKFSAGGFSPLFRINTRDCRAVRPAVQPLLETTYVPGTVFLARAEAIRQTGLLDERFFFSGEIADFCVRAGKLGFKSLIAPDTVAIHEADSNNPLRATLYRYYTLRNRFLFAQKHAGKLRLMCQLYWTLAGLAMLMLNPGRPKVARAIYLALRDGWRGQFGNRNEYFGC